MAYKKRFKIGRFFSIYFINDGSLVEINFLQYSLFINFLLYHTENCFSVYRIVITYNDKWKYFLRIEKPLN